MPPTEFPSLRLRFTKVILTLALFLELSVLCESAHAVLPPPSRTQPGQPPSGGVPSPTGTVPPAPVPPPPSRTVPVAPVPPSRTVPVAPVPPAPLGPGPIPELDPGSLVSALTLLTGGVLVLTGPRRRR
jgi:hypothetical protein